MEAFEHGHHFAGSLVEMLRSLNPTPGWFASVLESAGDPRPVDAVCDPGGWSTYEQFRALLEAAEILLGGQGALAGLADVVAAPTMPLIHSLMSAGRDADVIFEEIVAAGGSSIAPLVHVSGERTGVGEWVLRYSMSDGYPPFKAYCDFSRGMFAVVPRLLGLRATATEEACRCDGAPQCEVRVQWSEGEGTSIEYLEAKVQVLEAQLRAQQATVSDLISDEPLATVLERIVEAAARTVNAPLTILELAAFGPFTREIFTRGLTKEIAEEILARGDAREASDDSSQLLVDVASTRRCYGRLIAINPGGSFLPQQVSTLESYSSLAAAALDSATALDESRRQADIARALLQLSVSLAHTTSTSEIAETLAEAVPAVTRCDRSIIVMRESVTGESRVSSAFGYDAHTTRWLQSLTISPPFSANNDVAFYGAREASRSAFLNAIMQRTRTTYFAVAPIVVDGDVAGLLVADVASETRPAHDNDELSERLRGLAGQAATAIRNAQLLERIRHKSLHDPLTGLANRELIFDQAERVLARSRRTNEPSAALFIDLDGFKSVNDAFGHDAGDELIETAAHRLQEILRSSDTLGRFGGDEFVALLEIASVAETSEAVAQRILRALRQPVILQRAAQEVQITASIGIAIGVSCSASELLRLADCALYEAKASGKNCYKMLRAGEAVVLSAPA